MQRQGQGAAVAAIDENTAATAAIVETIGETIAAASPPTPPRIIAIIGGGFSGTCLAVHMLRRQTAARLEIRLFEPREAPGAGVAYATRDYPYPLNVAADRMSVDAAVPRDFLDFACAQGIHAAPGDYLPRQFYGEYLRARFTEACREAPANLRATHRRARVLQLRTTDDGRFELWLDDGSAQRADQVVLALGNSPPGKLAVFEPIAGTPGYLDDPWNIGQEKLDSVLLVGSGLTMVDAALRLAAIRPRLRHIHVISRHGLLPLPQAQDTRRECKPDLGAVLAAGSSVGALTRELRRVAAGVIAADGDWREVVNALRPHLPQLWSGLATAERERFLRHLRAWWEVHRHRVPAGALSAVRSLERNRVLEVHAGRLEALRLVDDSVEVLWRPRGPRRSRAWLVDRVINCTGPDTRLARNSDPLVQSLLRNGSIRSDAHALGIDVDAHGQVISRAGLPVDGLYYLGPWLRARDWEATAVPELRAHAARLASRLVADAGVVAATS